MREKDVSQYLRLVVCRKKQWWRWQIWMAEIGLPIGEVWLEGETLYFQLEDRFRGMGILPKVLVSILDFLREEGGFIPRKGWAAPSDYAGCRLLGYLGLENGAIDKKNGERLQ